MSFYAFKGFNHDLSCRDFQYEIGKTYVFDGPPIKCVQGFHYCTSLSAVFIYYPRYTYITDAYEQHPAWYYQYSKANLHNKPVQRILTSNRYCVVEVLGDVDDNSSTPLYEEAKGATNKIRIVKELNQDEIDDILDSSGSFGLYRINQCQYLLNFKEEE